MGLTPQHAPLQDKRPCLRNGHRRGVDDLRLSQNCRGNRLPRYRNRRGHCERVASIHVQTGLWGIISAEGTGGAEQRTVQDCWWG
jgi:hypothetical protein